MAQAEGDVRAAESTVAPRYTTNAFGHITGYLARCPWCGNAPLFIHGRRGFSVLCDACDVEWKPADEEQLFVVHADKLAGAAMSTDGESRSGSRKGRDDGRHE